MRAHVPAPRADHRQGGGGHPAAAASRRAPAPWRRALPGTLVCAGLLLGGCAPGLPPAALTAGVGTAQPVAPLPAPPPAAVESTAAPAPSGKAPVPVSFSDVPPGHWAAGAIGGLAGLGLLSGVAPGRFSPDAPVTRAEFAAMLTRAMGAPAGAVGPAFADVAHDAWYGPPVEAAAGLGWMRGVAPRTFSPGSPVSRAEAAVAAAAALGLGHVADDEAGRPGMCPFTDCSAIPAWAAGAADVLGHLGVMRGGSGGRLDPSAPLTRAEAAVLLWKARALTPNDLAGEGSRVADTVHVDGGAGVIEAGRSLTVHAYAHDVAGYIVPSAFQWSVTGPAHLASAGRDSAVISADGPGAVRVTAKVAGRQGVEGSAPVQALRMAALSVAGLPPEGLAHAAFPVHVSVRTAAGGLDTAIGTDAVTLVAQPAGGGTAVRTTAPVQWGKAAVAFPDLPEGAYTLTFQYPGLPDVQVPYQAVGRPVGAVRLTADGAGIDAGQVLDVRAELPAAGTWPITVTVAGTESGPAPLTGEAPPPPVLRVVSTAAALTGAGVAASVAGNAPGTAAVTVAVPGGALAAATLEVPVRATGAFGGARAPQEVVAGQTATVAIAVSGSPGPVSLEPVDPAGHPLPAVAATVAGGFARAAIAPHTAGVWRLRWRAPGALPVEAGTLQVRPGPAVRLMAAPSPTSVLLPGQEADLRVWPADSFGNPVPEGLRLEASVTGGHGDLRLTRSRTSGPDTVGTFTATTVGTTTLRLSSPDHPDLPPATVTFRTIASPADRVAGKGLWLTFPDWKSKPDDQIVADALAAGATHLYLEVATSSDGFYGARALDALLPRAHAAGLAVLAWVYPALGDPAADTSVLRAVAAYRTPGGDAADGLGLDIEENLDPAAVGAYAAAADTAVGPSGLVVGITWAPQQRPDYPYAALASHVGAFAPMDYWHVFEADYSYTQVYRWVADSVTTIRRLSGKPQAPVEVIAGTFDWFSGSGQGIFSPTAAEVLAAVRAASDAGAIGVSFYRGSTATPEEQAVITGTAWPPAE